MIGYFPVQSYLSTKYGTKMQKKLHPKIAENFSPLPPSRRGFDFGFEKTISYFCRLLWENQKSAAGENFRNRNYFYTKNSAKNAKKMANRKWGGGTDFGFHLGIPPAGGIT